MQQDVAPSLHKAISASQGAKSKEQLKCQCISAETCISYNLHHGGMMVLLH